MSVCINYSANSPTIDNKEGTDWVQISLSPIKNGNWLKNGIRSSCHISQGGKHWKPQSFNEVAESNVNFSFKLILVIEHSLRIRWGLASPGKSIPKKKTKRKVVKGTAKRRKENARKVLQKKGESHPLYFKRHLVIKNLREQLEYDRELVCFI